MSESGDQFTQRRSRTLSLVWESMVKLDQTKLLSVEATRERMRPTEGFCTGSYYTGTWNDLNMQGFGNYVLPYGVEYEGEMSDGMFHGEGTLKYPCGYKIMGTWEKGRLVSFQYQFPDGLMYSDPWAYCRHPDRRFFFEHKEGKMSPAGREVLTNEQPTPDLPEGCYDVGDGVYYPRNKYVLPTGAKFAGRDVDTSDDMLFQFMRGVSKEEENWIKQNCRKAWDEPTGYRKDLHGHWFSGREADLQDIEDVQVYYNLSVN